MHLEAVNRLSKDTLEITVNQTYHWCTAYRTTFFCKHLNYIYLFSQFTSFIYVDSCYLKIKRIFFILSYIMILLSCIKWERFLLHGQDLKSQLLYKIIMLFLAFVSIDNLFSSFFLPTVTQRWKKWRVQLPLSTKMPTMHLPATPPSFSTLQTTAHPPATPQLPCWTQNWKAWSSPWPTWDLWSR